MIFGRPYPKPLTGADFGRTDVTLRFAWIPVRLTDGQFVWLEQYADVRRVGYDTSGALYESRLSWQPDKVLHMDQYHNWLGEDAMIEEPMRDPNAASS